MSSVLSLTSRGLQACGMIPWRDCEDLIRILVCTIPNALKVCVCGDCLVSPYHFGIYDIKYSDTYNVSISFGWFRNQRCKSVSCQRVDLSGKNRWFVNSGGCWIKARLKLSLSGPKVRPSWPKVGPKSFQNRFRVGRASARVGTKSFPRLLKVAPKWMKSQPTTFSKRSNVNPSLP